MCCSFHSNTQDYQLVYITNITIKPKVSMRVLTKEKLYKAVVKAEELKAKNNKQKRMEDISFNNAL
jgi:hypothetical protein